MLLDAFDPDITIGQLNSQNTMVLVPKKTNYLHSFANVMEITDFLGVSKIIPLADYRKIIKFNYLFEDLVERKYFLDFITSKKNVYGFWAIDYLSEMKVKSVDINSPLNIYIEATDFLTSFRGYEKLVKVDFQNKIIYYRDIVNVSVIDTYTEMIEISSELTLKEGDFLYLMLYGRLKENSFSIRYGKVYPRNFGVAEVEFIELPDEAVLL